MKELVADFRLIIKKDRGLFGWMIFDFLLSLALFLIPLFFVDSSKAKMWARYSDISNGYSQSDWWYILSFSVIALTFGIGHILLSVRLFSKRGKDIARLFLGISIAILIIAIKFLLNIVLEG